MRFQRRHYVLIVLIIAIGAFNFWRIRRAHQQPTLTSPSSTQPIVRGTSPTWPLYDTVAALRDAPDEQFQPALKSLNQSLDNTNAVAVPPQTSHDEIADLHGCQTWLLFYRAEHLHPTSKPGWLAQTRQHVDSCVTHHRDVAQ